MPSFMKKIQDFAKSPQGKKLVDDAKKMASDPKTKQKIDEARKKFMGGGSTGGHKPTGDGTPPTKPPAA
jgi:hypothetical protein